MGIQVEMSFDSVYILKKNADACLAAINDKFDGDFPNLQAAFEHWLMFLEEVLSRPADPRTAISMYRVEPWEEISDCGQEEFFNVIAPFVARLIGTVYAEYGHDTYVKYNFRKGKLYCTKGVIEYPEEYEVEYDENWDKFS